MRERKRKMAVAMIGRGETEKKDGETCSQNGDQNGTVQNGDNQKVMNKVHHCRV